jgi:hypothetical protein
MDFGQRLRRITDLFTEGVAVNFGDDPDGHPVLVWINKLNSFEVEEARRDGAARRGVRLAALGEEDSPERAALRAEVGFWSDEELAERWVLQKSEEHYLDALNDIEADSKWKDKLESLRRLPTLMREASGAEDDPRRDELIALQQEYYTAISDLQKKRQADAAKDASNMERADLETGFFENWRQRVTLDEFMEERRVTELFFAMRSCDGTRVGPAEFDHENCDHQQRALEERALVRRLPQPVLDKCLQALDELTVPLRDAGNSDAPASSSASSEQQSEPEASTPSTPAETSPDAPTT